MFKPPYNPTEKEVKAEIEKYGYWKITLQPETKDDDAPKEIENFFEVFNKSRIKRNEQYFPHLSDEGYGENSKKNEHVIESHKHYAEYISWWRFHKNGLFEMEMGLVEDRSEGVTNPQDHQSWTPDKQIAPKNKKLDPNIALHMLIEIERFTKNLMRNTKRNYWMSINLCDTKGRHLRSFQETENKFGEFKINNSPLIDDNDPKKFICEVNKIEVDTRFISKDDLNYTFVLVHMNYIYYRFNYPTSDIHNCIDIIENERKKYYQNNIIGKEEYNYKLK